MATPSKAPKELIVLAYEAMRFKSLQAVADQFKVSRQYVSQVLKGRGDDSPDQRADRKA